MKTGDISDETPPMAWLAAAVGCVGIALTAVETAVSWLAQPGDPWNAARLAPAIALHHGFRLYYPLDHGPVLSTVVGPVAFLAYWPVGFVRGSPTLLILMGCALNLAAFATLGAWFLRRLPVSKGTRLILWLIAVQLVLFYPSLRYSIFCIHADAPALILGASGSVLLLLAPGEPSWRRCATAALCFALAAWAKQSFVLIFPAMAIALSLQAGRRAAVRLVLASVGVAAVVSLCFAVWLGFRALWDNMIVVPSHHPWQEISLTSGETYPHLHAAGPVARLKVLVAESLHIVRQSWPVFALFAALLLDRARRRGPGESWWPRTPWSAFLLLSICLFPVAAVGRAKVGGEVNQESFVILFLVAALLAWLAESTRRPGSPGVIPAAVLGVLLVINAPQALGYRGWRAAWDNQNQVAFRYDLAHPGAVYFPWNPLTSLLAEGRLYHFDYGVFDRNLGGAWVSADHISRGLPASRPVIASTIAHHDYVLRTYFSDYVELPPSPELPGWRLYGPPHTP